MPPKTKLCLLIAQQCRTLYTLTFFHCTNSSILFTNGHVFSSSKTAWISKSRERVRAQIITTSLLQMGNRLGKGRGCVGGVGQQVTLQVVQYRGTNHPPPSPPPPSPPSHHLNLQHNPWLPTRLVVRYTGRGLRRDCRRGGRLLFSCQRLWTGPGKDRAQRNHWRGNNSEFWSQILFLWGVARIS